MRLDLRCVQPSLFVATVLLLSPALHGQCQEQTITASDGDMQDFFGASVAVFNDTMIVGADFDDDLGTNVGAAYIFERGGDGQWTETTRIDPTTSFAEFFGDAVDIYVDWVAVGCPLDNEGGATNAGAVHLFQRDLGGSDNWGFHKRILAGDVGGTDEFGTTVSMVLNTLVVGAPFDDDNGSDAGAVYIYSRNTGGPDNWGLTIKLFPSDPAPNQRFGAEVEMSGNTVIVGTSVDLASADVGAAYIFDRNFGGTNNWGQVKKLVGSDTVAGDGFGRHVSGSSTAVVVGAPYCDAQGEDSGAAYVFERDEGGSFNWGQKKKLIACQTMPGDLFGTTVRKGANEVFVTARDAELKFPTEGAVYVFGRNVGGDGNWGYQAELQSFGITGSGVFGRAIDVQPGGHVLVSAVGDNGFMGSVMAYQLPDPCISWRTPAATSSLNGFAVSGLVFTPQVDIEVTALGFYDDTFTTFDGLSNSHEVAIYDEVTENLVTFALVPAGNATEKINDFRFRTISPVQLDAGTTYVIASADTGDRVRSIPLDSDYYPTDVITVEEWRSASGPAVEYPFIVVSGAARTLGPTFKFDVIDVWDCVEDINGDCTVNLFDLLTLLDNWGTDGPGADIASPFDRVDLFDLLALIDAWGDC